MRVAAFFVATLATASAFVPRASFPSSSTTRRSQGRVSMDLSGLVGSDVEIPEFDPLGLSKGKDEETLGWYRAAELKHGRVCMLASVGYIVQGLYHLPDGPFEASKPLDALVKVRGERGREGGRQGGRVKRRAYCCHRRPRGAGRVHPEVHCPRRSDF